MLLLLPVVAFFAFNLNAFSVSASYVLVRQTLIDQCNAACFPALPRASNAIVYFTELCNQQDIVLVVLDCFHTCPANIVGIVVGELQIKCEELGININVPINTTLTTSPAPTTPPTTLATNKKPSATETSSRNTSTISSASISGPSTSPSSDASSSINTSLIVGCVVGLIFALAILIFLVIMYRRRIQSHQRRSQSDAHISLARYPFLQKFDGQDDESVEKLRFDGLGTTDGALGPISRLDGQQQSHAESETRGSQVYSLGHWGGSSEGGVHQTGGEGPTSDAGPTRRVTNCGYEPNTQRPGIGAALKYELRTGPPVYEEEVGLLDGARRVTHGS